MSNNFELENDINTSGMGRYAHPPNGISRSFNLGAFCFNFFWLMYYKQYFFALLFSICFVLFTIPSLRLFVLIIYFALGLSVGRFGNVWAWRARKYKSVSNFNNVHSKIAIVGVIFQIIFMTFVLRTIHIDNSFLMMLESPGMYYFDKNWNVDNKKTSQNPNPINQVEEIYNSTKGQENKIKFLKVLSTLNSAFIFHGELQTDNTENLSGSDLADIVRNNMRDVTYYKNNVIKTSDGVVYQFESKGGDCLDSGCYVLIDIDGVENGPNKYWKDEKNIYDRLRVDIKRDKNGILEIIKPKILL